MGEGLRGKIVYNNYQFYENLPLQNYVEREWKKGFYLSKAYGRFGSFLLFKREGERKPRYFRYRRASLKGEEEGQKAAVQEKPYYVISEQKSAGTWNGKENGVPVRGGLLLTAALLLLSGRCDRCAGRERRTEKWPADFYQEKQGEGTFLPARGRGTPVPAPVQYRVCGKGSGRRAGDFSSCESGSCRTPLSGHRLPSADILEEILS